MAMRIVRQFEMQSGLVVAPKLFIRKATKACKLYLFRSCQVEQDRRTKPTSEMSELMN